jgi:hypothetical protein
MSATKLTAEATVQKTRGEIRDYYTDWIDRMRPAFVSASAGTGAWFLAGETGSAYNWYTYSAGINQFLTGIHSGMEHIWSSSGFMSGTATAYGSALIGLRTHIRLWNNQDTATGLKFSAWMRTTSAGASGRVLVRRFHMNVIDIA